MVLFLATVAFAYLLEAVLVGCAWATAARRFGWPAPTPRAAYLLVLVFAFLDLYWFPAAVAADVTFTVGNADLAGLLGLRPDTKITDLVTVGFLDLLVWFLQAGVALFMGQAAARPRAV